MKRCPQCNTVFEDTQVYCTEDGVELVNENFTLPSESSLDEEEITIIHHEPIKVEIPNSYIKNTEQITGELYDIPQTENAAPVVIIEKRANTGKYVLFTILGIFLGSVLVVGAFLIFSQMRRSNNSNSVENIQISSGKHNEPNKTRKDSEFNGFVLSDSANIRSAPGSTVLDSVPKNDRLSILERDNAWYRVICEHGVTGWMHGNTIRFNDNETPF